MASTHVPTRKPYQHYIWQNYLKAWAPTGSLHCLMDERIFLTGTKALGVENDFYKLQDLTNEDLV
jgi:hypothetical protein